MVKRDGVILEKIPLSNNLKIYILFRSHTHVLPFRQPVSQVPVLDEDMVEREMGYFLYLISSLPLIYTG